jgi:hypothetical protein
VSISFSIPNKIRSPVGRDLSDYRVDGGHHGGSFLMDGSQVKKLFDEQKTDPSPQAMWSFIQRQIEQLRGQMSDGLNKNILQLTEQQRTVNEQLRGITDQVNRQLQTSSGEIKKRLDNAARVIGDVLYRPSRRDP